MSNTSRPMNKVTVVEEGTEFRGTLTSSCPVDVRGRVEGELATPTLTVSASGAVHGRAKVGEVRSLGEISGEFDAERVELAGVVRDNTVIRARSLDVKLASERGKLQIIFGECELSVGEEPREADHAVEPAVHVAAPAPAPMLEAPAAALEAPAEMAAVVANADSALAPNAAEEEADEDGDEASEMAPAAGGKKGKRRKKNGHEEPVAGWSQPPSQPPPAN
ncbi:MAG TPA: polymer-forming cytoskeletal protein [Polyangiaceae bacterium]|nr:polymer-forming cytoskeletal protein [Polyangiaceae bacterium]